MLDMKLMRFNSTKSTKARSVIRSVKIVMMGLILSACSHRDPTLARVGSATVKASELRARYNALPAEMQRNFTSEVRHRLVDSLIRGKVVEAMAKIAGLDSKTYVQRLMTTDLTVSKEEIAAYLKSHPELSKNRLRNDFALAALRSTKFNAWLEKAKATSVPVTIDEAAVNSVDLSKK